MKVALISSCLVVICVAPLRAADSHPATTTDAKFPLPAPPEDPKALGVGIQRTMSLLATSTPEHRHKVRILFYGQSITEQEWSKAVADDLRKRFPHADLDIQNRAIGGFASQLLIRPAEHDLYPFYPDLVIFHVYGANQQYEEIIKNIRTRTTAEVVMQKDHVTAWPPEKPDPNKDKGLWWDHMMNHVFLPDIAKKYGCALVDVRSPWLAYLKDNHLEPKALLKDGVHLNDHGNFLMAALVSRYLVHRPDLKPGAEQDLVKTLVVGKDIKWSDGKLTVDFGGNRVDALAAPRSTKAYPAPAKVLIDGKKPSEFPGCYSISRPEPGPWSPVFLSRVDHDAPLMLEEWTITVTSADEQAKSFKFDVVGSVTGADGSGESKKPFLSKSGRAKIDPEAWFMPGKTPPVGYQVHWKVRPLFTDEYTTPPVDDLSREYPTTLAQGLENGKHRLEIVGQAEIAEIRVYRPPQR